MFCASQKRRDVVDARDGEGKRGTEVGAPDYCLPGPGPGPRPRPRSVWARAAVERLAGFGPAVSDVGDDNDEGQLEWQREWCLRSGD